MIARSLLVCVLTGRTGRCKELRELCHREVREFREAGLRDLLISLTSLLNCHLIAATMSAMRARATPSALSAVARAARRSEPISTSRAAMSVPLV